MSSPPISRQPAASNALYTYSNPWHEKLFASFKPCPNSALACFCLPCYSALLVRRGGDHILTCCINPNALMLLRTKVRAAYQIQGSFIEDCLITSCLGPCAAMQIEKELDFRDIPKKQMK